MSVAGSAPPRTNRERFLRACAVESVDRPPCWLMRQAGRALPEYRELKQKYSFLELVQTPELATQVTLQPIERFDFDAAILFSDILVIAEALGQRYRFRDTGGIQMEFALDSSAAIDRLQTHAVTDRLEYVAAALRLLRPALAGRTALIGFAGSPWTLANFMVEGGSSRTFTKARRLFLEQPQLFSRLCEKLTRAIVDYCRMQIQAGAEAIQLFDTLGACIEEDRFADASARWLREIVAELNSAVPVIVFAKGVNQSWNLLVGTGARVLSVDATVRLAEVRASLPADVGVQGNLDPALLTTASADGVAQATRRLLEDMRGARGHILNLGHGVPPDARLENIEALIRTVQRFA
ncbi:MAG: uroporphyrinogen decarboxylase [Verrucomicrobia bacterium]|nr:uroporphyrinogen decarboxylase [Verrucomicrobiota bacterium]